MPNYILFIKLLKAKGRCCITDNKKMNVSIKQQEEMFTKNNASQVVLDYVKNGHLLCQEAQVKVFELYNWREIFNEYLEHHPLAYSAEVKLFEQKDSYDFIFNYVKSGKRLYPKSQLSILNLPNWEEIIRLYIKNNYLNTETEIEILKCSSDVKKFVEVYNEHYAFSPEAQIKFFELENASEVVEIYINKRPLCDDAEVLMMALPNAESLAKKYVELYPNFLCIKAQEKVFDLSNAAEIMKIYINSFNRIKPDYILGEVSQIKLFSLDEAKELVKVYIKKCKMSDDAEVLMLDVLDFEDIEWYIKNYTLGVKAQLKLLKMAK